MEFLRTTAVPSGQDRWETRKGELDGSPVREANGSIELEAESQSKLPETPLIVVAIVGQSAQAAFLAGDDEPRTGPKAPKVRVEAIHVHIVMVEDVESFGAELEFHAFRQGEELTEGEVEVPSTWSAEGIPCCHIGGKWSKVGNPTKRSVAETIGHGKCQEIEDISALVYPTARSEAGDRSRRHVPRYATKTEVQGICAVRNGE